MRIDVTGLPAPQGSKHGFAIKRAGKFTGKVAQVESSKRVKPWRQDVKHAALKAIASTYIEIGPWEPMADPISVKVFFYLPRPKGHHRTGANAALLRDSAPSSPAGRPDLDKLIRSTFDALGEAGVWVDDAQVVRVLAEKHYSDCGRLPGAIINVQAADVPAMPAKAATA